MTAKPSILTALFSAALLLAGSAHAVLSLDKSVTLSDEFGGVLQIVSSGELDIPGADIVSSATFSHFHPGAQDRSVNGQVERQRSRANQEITSSYSGSMTFDAVDADGNALQNVVEFVDLTLVRSEQGPQLSGSVILNGEVIDASAMPQQVAVLLRRVLRFFYLA
jgi:hypothetical protein